MTEISRTKSRRRLQLTRRFTLLLMGMGISSEAVAIIGVLVALAPSFSEQNQIYAYAIGVLVGTAIQFAIPAWDLRHTPFRMNWKVEWRMSPDVRRVLLLMLPVTISLGLINFNLSINSLFGTLVEGTIVSPDGAIKPLGNYAPAAIDKAFRIYMLPQGMFSVAVATVIFPTLSRFAARPRRLRSGRRHFSPQRVPFLSHCGSICLSRWRSFSL